VRSAKDKMTFNRTNKCLAVWRAADSTTVRPARSRGHNSRFRKARDKAKQRVEMYCARCRFLGGECPVVVLPGRALCSPTFSHVLIVISPPPHDRHSALNSIPKSAVGSFRVSGSRTKKHWRHLLHVLSTYTVRTSWEN